MAATAGLDPMRWLLVDDDIEREYLRTIGKKMIEVREETNKRLANYIVGELARAMERGNRRQRGANTTSTS